MDYCRIQWGSKNLTKIIFGENSTFGLKEINFSLPIPFEFTENEEYFLTLQESKELLSVNYEGYQSDHKYSLMNYDNLNFLLKNLDQLNMVSYRFNISKAKSGELIKWIKRLYQSLKVIDNSNPELAYFRGSF